MQVTIKCNTIEQWTKIIFAIVKLFDLHEMIAMLEFVNNFSVNKFNKMSWNAVCLRVKLNDLFN